MSEEKKSFWARVFSTHPSESEKKVLEYIVHRTGEGASLHSVVEEEYVRRNATQSQIDEILSDPKLVHAARERMEEAFRSGELDPGRKPDAG